MDQTYTKTFAKLSEARAWLAEAKYDNQSISMTMDLYVHVTEDEKVSEMMKMKLPRAAGG